MYLGSYIGAIFIDIARWLALPRRQRRWVHTVASKLLSKGFRGTQAGVREGNQAGGSLHHSAFFVDPVFFNLSPYSEATMSALRHDEQRHKRI
jgi:hypothetical protein